MAYLAGLFDVKVASLTNSGPNIERESARPTSSGTYELK